jgi:O-antigen biosynthesis protein
MIDFKIRSAERNKPLVSIIISFKDGYFFLRKCIESIIKKTSYKDYEIILVDNNSLDSRVLEYIESLKNTYPNIRLINYKNPFNFSKINNLASVKANGEYLLFLNSDTKIISERWIESLIKQLQKKNTGIAGAKLLFPNGNIQHCGIIIYKNFPLHCFYNLNKKLIKDNFLINKVEDYPAVTGACMAIRKKIFKELGGFDEKFAVLYNDVDLCLRMWERGYKIVYTPYAELIHYESATRDKNQLSRAEKEKEFNYFIKKWENKKNYPNYESYLKKGLKIHLSGKIWASLMNNKLFYDIKKVITSFVY